MPRARLWLCSTVCPTALMLASPYEGEDDDFVVICTNRAVLDVGLLSLHDLRADSLIRPIASRSVIQLLSNHCHFNNHIFSAGHTLVENGWTLDKPMDSLCICHLGVLPSMAILLKGN